MNDEGRVQVWAPRASRVTLERNGAGSEMEPSEGGWFVSPGRVPPAEDYSFRLDGGDSRPDPRSRHQPRGVHGPSRTVDDRSFAWSDADWKPPSFDRLVIYEMHVGTFSPEGTFDGAITKLDHVVDLGATALEVMPVAQFPGKRGWGYDGVDLFAVHDGYGGPDGFKRLVDACHQRGLAVILDVVYNHLGPDGNYLPEFGPYFTEKYATPWGAAVNFDDRGSDEVRRFVIDNALMWLERYHVDGLRLDAVHAILDSSATHILEELAVEVASLEARLGRDLWLIAESDLNDPRIVTPRDAGGYGLDAQWSDDFHHALHALLTGERDGYYRDFGRVADVAKALGDVFVYDDRYSAYRERRHGRSTRDLSGHRFLAYLQNHDQVGNRATGDRSSMLMVPELLEVGAALVLTSPFVPMLFQGEEWGASTPFQYFTDHEDPDLAQAVSEGRKREFAAFGWDPDAVPDPQDLATFAASKLDWDEIGRAPHAELLDWHRDLIALRHARPELRDGRRDLVAVLYDEDGRWLTVERGGVTVTCSLAGHPAPESAGHSVVLSGSHVTVSVA